MTVPSNRRVAVYLPGSFSAGVTAGVIRFASERANWRLQLIAEHTDLHSWLSAWRGDGIIIYLQNRKEAKLLSATGLAAVSVSATLVDSGVPVVTDDHEMIGRLAAEHLLARGLRRFAFFGSQGIWYSAARERGFARRVEEAGCVCNTYSGDPITGYSQDEQDRFDRWIRSLQPPVGMLASHDPRTVMALEACERIGLRVPDDVAVVGVNDHQTLCLHSHPPLSSIPRDEDRIGFEAGALLDRLMNGEPAPKQPVLIPCKPLVVRRSSEILAIEDPEIAAAARYIHDHLAEPFGVERLLTLSPISRSSLEKGFLQWLGCSPYRYICRVRIDRAKALLESPGKIKLLTILRECGFRTQTQFRETFERVESMTPLEYRKRFKKPL